MILKAGTYRFNDNISYIFGTQEYAFSGFVNGNIKFNKIVFQKDHTIEFAFDEDYIANPLYGFTDGWWNADLETATNAPTVTIGEQNVNNVFGGVFIANTNYYEVNAQGEGTTIKWNGDTTDRQCLTFEDGNIFFYKVSDNIYSLEQLTNYKYAESAGENGSVFSTDVYEGEEMFEALADDKAYFPDLNIFIGNDFPLVEGMATQILILDGYINGEYYHGTYFQWFWETEEHDTYIFISSLTLPNAINPLAEITYNGETIAQLNAGETATLSCEGKKMASDVVVKVNEVESEIPDGYVKPEGTLELVFNNIEAEFPIDCSKYAKVTVNTAEPLKITDPTVLDNITDSPYGVGGNVFLYEGATTDSYENGVLYYLEDTEK